jgi:hypothetical protein
VLLGDVHHDRAGLEETHRRAAAFRLGIDQRRHAVVGREFQEFGIELVAAADIGGLDGVRHAEFFQKYGDLLAVRRRPVEKFKHRVAPSVPAKSLA